MSSMIQLDVIQGSEEWQEKRLRAWNASEAPVMMGCHPNMRRDELLEAKATCNPKQYSDFVEKRVFAKGHETEAKARPILEEMLGEDLYPVSGANGRYQASFDGLTLMQDRGFEHKQWNEDLAAAVAANDPPPYIYWQLEHQLLVCPDLERIILVVSDGAPDKWQQMEYRAVPGRREQLIAGWEQFERDLAEFKPTEKKAELVGVAPDSLPILMASVSGQLATKDNLAEFRAGAERLVGAIKKDLVTDQDFADAEQAIKWLKEQEAKCDLLIERILAETGPVDALVRGVRDVQKNIIRAARLGLEPQVKNQKDNQRNKIVADAEAAFSKFLDSVNAEFAASKVRITNAHPDFYAAIKGKRSFSLMTSACNDLIAQCKIMVSEMAAKYRSNLAMIAEHAEHEFLFSGDRQTLVDMSADHLALTIDRRIAHYAEKQASDETARKQKHQNTIAALTAAGDALEGLPIGSLIATRNRLQSFDASKLEEFTIEAEKARTTSLTNVVERIAVLEKQAADAAEAERLKQQQAAPAPTPKAVSPISGGTAPKPAPVAQQDLVPGIDDLEPTIHSAEQAVTFVTKQSRPTDEEITEVLALHYRVHEAIVLSWLLDMDLEHASNQLAVNF